VAYLKDYKNRERSPLISKDWCYRWSELVCHLDDWYEERPEEVKPIISIPPGEGKDDSPFPTVLYGHGSASMTLRQVLGAVLKLTRTVSGNQLYHTATLLMLQGKPAGLTVQRKQVSNPTFISLHQVPLAPPHSIATYILIYPSIK
jgi:hypothetical protein